MSTVDDLGSLVSCPRYVPRPLGRVPVCSSPWSFGRFRKRLVVGRVAEAVLIRGSRESSAVISKVASSPPTTADDILQTPLTLNAWVRLGSVFLLVEAHSLDSCPDHQPRLGRLSVVGS